MHYKWRFLSVLTGVSVGSGLVYEIFSSIQTAEAQNMFLASEKIEQELPEVEVIISEIPAPEEVEVIPIPEPEIVEVEEREEAVVKEPEPQIIPKPPQEKPGSPPKDPITVSQNPNYETTFPDRKFFAIQGKDKLLDTSNKSWWKVNEQAMIATPFYDVKTEEFQKAYRELWVRQNNYDGSILMQTCHNAYLIKYDTTTHFSLSHDVWFFCQKIDLG